MSIHVALEGGPLDGWWYTGESWGIALVAAQNMGRAANQPQGYVLGYQRTHRIVRKVLGKKKKQLVADVWWWRP